MAHKDNLKERERGKGEFPPFLLIALFSDLTRPKTYPLFSHFFTNIGTMRKKF